jgi:GDP-L-fucose synthase
MTLNLLEACHLFRVARLVNPISNCSYPGSAEFFKEDEYWDGPLHESVMVYGFVRKASWVGAWAYAKQYDLDVLNLIFSNMYGPGDHFEEERSHALGALIMKFVEAKKKNLPEVVVWGTGAPVREWLHVDDASEAMVRGLKAPRSESIVNVGIGKGVSIIEMANLIKSYVGFSGKIVLDTSKQDGAPYKTVDGRRGEELLGWKPSKDFHRGIEETINWYIKESVNGSN